MKQVLLILMLCFGAVSFAYAQEATSVVERVASPERIQERVGEVKEARSEFLEDKKQALEIRAEKQEEFKTRALETKEDLKIQFNAATTTEAKQAIREEAAEKREEFQADVQEVRQDWRERVKEYFNNRIEGAFERFTAHVEKAEEVDARIVSVLERLDEAGVDTTSVNQTLIEARRGIADVKETIRTVTTNLEQVIETGSQEEVREAFNESKAEITSATRILKAAYLDIRESIATSTNVDIETEL